MNKYKPDFIQLEALSTEGHLSKKLVNVVRNSIYSINLDFFKKESNELFWLIGLLSADGSVRKTNTFSITQSNSHGLDMITYIKNLVSYTGVISKYKNSHGLTITNKEIKPILEYYGVVNNKTLINTPMNIPNNYFKSYLRGYFEGDGSVGIYNVGGSSDFLNCSFVGTSELIEYVEKFIPTGYKLKTIKRCKNLKEIRYTGKFAHKFLNWLYRDNSLYKSKKLSIYNSWLEIDHEFIRYDMLKEKAKTMHENGMNCIMIAKELDLNFQLIYSWKDRNFKKYIEMEND